MNCSLHELVVVYERYSGDYVLMSDNSFTLKRQNLFKYSRVSSLSPFIFNKYILSNAVCGNSFVHKTSRLRQLPWFCA